MRIDYGPVRIEIGDTCGNPRYFDRVKGEGADQMIDFTRFTAVEIFGVEVPVIPLPDLLAYKAALKREVDLLDIAELA